MPPPSTIDELLDLVRKSGLVEAQRLDVYLEQLRTANALAGEPKMLASLFVRDGLLTHFQAGQLLQGRWRGFTVGKYRILERLGSGGMGLVYLGEHTLMHRLVAIKVLPLSLAGDPWFLDQFYREAQVVAALDHPNIVRAHDIDKEGNLHFLIMEYVDGTSLHEIVSKHGPMDILRAAHYIRQAAVGLQHAYELGLVHRDIKPGNLLLNRQGTIKILDLGLACFSRSHPKEAANDKDTDKRMVGTDDFLAPEQIVNSDDVDIRADIYGLGATFYFLLTSKAPFHDVSVDHHKLMGHLLRHPKPVRSLRADVPEALEAVIDKMLAKNPWERYPSPASVAEALADWTQTPIPAPPATEMPNLSSVLCKPASLGPKPSSATRPAGAGRSWVVCGQTPNSASGSGIVAEPSTSQAQTSTASTPVTRPTANPVPEPAPPPSDQTQPAS